MSTIDPSSLVQSIADLLRRMPELHEVSVRNEAPGRSAQARFQHEMLGRKLAFIVTPHQDGGLRFLVPNFLRAPMTREFGCMHVQALGVNGAIDGRVVVDCDGCVQYELTALGTETADAAVIRALVLQVQRELRLVLGALVTSGIGSVFSLSPELALQMVHSADPSLFQGRAEGGDSLGARIAV